VKTIHIYLPVAGRLSVVKVPQLLRICGMFRKRSMANAESYRGASFPGFASVVHQKVCALVSQSTALFHSHIFRQLQISPADFASSSEALIALPCPSREVPNAKKTDIMSFSRTSSSLSQAQTYSQKKSEEAGCIQEMAEEKCAAMK
jgi:hypothetical protein